MKYDRIWDVLMIASNGWYDFVDMIEANARYVMGKIPGGKLLSLVVPDGQHGHIDGRPLTEALPPTGVVVYPVPTFAFTHALTNRDTLEMMKWVSSPFHKGKIRFNGHGTETGKVAAPMGPKNAEGYRDIEYLKGEHLADWIEAHKLPPIGGSILRRSLTPAGLLTINLSICHGALDSDSHSSVAQDLMQGLSKLYHYGIKITGTALEICHVSTPTEWIVQRQKDLSAIRAQSIGKKSHQETASTCDEMLRGLTAWEFKYVNTARRSRALPPLIPGITPPCGNWTQDQLFECIADIVIAKRHVGIHGEAPIGKQVAILERDPIIGILRTGPVKPSKVFLKTTASTDDW